jgi:hypothetical protein
MLTYLCLLVCLWSAPVPVPAPVLVFVSSAVLLRIILLDDH